MNANPEHTKGRRTASTSLASFSRGEYAPAAAVAALFVIAAGALFFAIGRAFDPNIGKDWWTLSYSTRDTASSVFRIENHSKATRFTYEVSRNGTTLAEGAVSVASGTTGTFAPDVVSAPGRTSVSVTADDDTKKEIYRER